MSFGCGNVRPYFKDTPSDPSDPPYSFTLLSKMDNLNFYEPRSVVITPAPNPCA
jgi:hypothetical protein